MPDSQIRYQSFGVNYFTVNTRLYNSGWTNTDDSVYTSNGEWLWFTCRVTRSCLPSEIAQVRSLAKGGEFQRHPVPAETDRAHSKPASLPEHLHPPEGDQPVLPLLEPEPAVLVAEPQLQDLRGPDQPGVLRQVRLQPFRKQRAVLRQRREADLRAVHQQVLEAVAVITMDIVRRGCEIAIIRRLPAGRVITRSGPRRR